MRGTRGECTIGTMESLVLRQAVSVGRRTEAHVEQAEDKWNVVGDSV